MTAKHPRQKDDQLFVRDGRRAYRRRFSVREARIGFVLLVVLAAIGAWIAWMGKHPDASLFASTPELVAVPAKAADRGPLPSDLAAPGWSAGDVSQFDATNLYVKIDGREDYYKTFGFERLYCMSLTQDANIAAIVDIELFDLGTAANALGAYAGERGGEVAAETNDGGMSHRARNALYMARGRYYLRAIGADESAAVLLQLAQVRQVMARQLRGEALPWGYALFVGELGLDPSQVSYTAENAFSFGFAHNVYVGRLEDDTEMFVLVARNAVEARDLATRFEHGFLQYGAIAAHGPQVTWIRDRYLGALAGATAHGDWVLGIRAAPDTAEANAGLERLRSALVRVGPALRSRDASAADNADSGYHVED